MALLRFKVDFPTTGSYGAEAAVPVEVLDAEGALLANTVAVPYDEPASIRIADDQKVVYARARLPSGETQMKKIQLIGAPVVETSFFTNHTSPNEWLEWTRPVLRMSDLLSSNAEITNKERMWMRLWIWDHDHWSPRPLEFPRKVERATYATQFDLNVPHASCLLQIGSRRIPWRFISLPPGNIQVAIAANPSKDPGDHPLRIVIGRGKPSEEILLAFLENGQLSAASDVASAPRTAERLLAGKYDDPVSACIGAYFLLKTNNLQRLHYWPQNLYNDFRYIPDGAIIHAALLLRLDRTSAAEIVLREVFERGLPIFREGLNVMYDCLRMLEARESNRARAKPLRRVREYMVAEAGVGPYMSFLGRDPVKPDPIPVQGLPNTPRRQNIYATRGIHRTERAQGRFLTQKKNKRTPGVRVSGRDSGATAPSTLESPRRTELEDKSVFFIPDA